MKAARYTPVIALAVVLLMAAAEFTAVEGVTCNPTQLSPCAAAITSKSPPTRLCCAKLREQKPCLCGYMRNPSLRRYVNSPNARKVARSCRVPNPRC